MSVVRAHPRRGTRGVRRHPRRSGGHLYTHGAQASQLRAFQKRYGKRKGALVYGAVIGKVRREQFEAGTRGREEWVSPHKSHSRTGRPEHVRGHVARVE